MNRIGIIGDFRSTDKLHIATNEALAHAAQRLGIAVSVEWVPTESLEAGVEDVLAPYSGLLIATGSPYKSMSGALQAIEYARVHHIPAIGTCGGFQHMVIEFARNVLHIQDAQHAETDPYASRLVVNPLSCNLKGAPLEIEIVEMDSISGSAYGRQKVMEKYYCNFGLNPVYQQQLHDAGFRIVGSDIHKEARIMELEGHPFFVATLFVPQDSSSAENPHPLMEAFIQSMQMEGSKNKTNDNSNYIPAAQ